MIQKGTVPFCTILIKTAQGGVGIVVLQDLAVGVALGSHHCGAYLAQAYSVTPAGSFKDESVLSLFNYERTAEQVRFGLFVPSISSS